MVKLLTDKLGAPPLIERLSPGRRGSRRRSPPRRTAGPAVLENAAASAALRMLPHSTSTAGRVDRFSPPRSSRGERPADPM